MKEAGLLIVLSGPSGTGKGTLLHLLKDDNPNIRLSVSATTRKPRQGEVDGRDYYFKTVDEFLDMIKNDDLLEWVEYCNNYYGTPKKFIEESINEGYDVLFEIEVEGAMKIKEKLPDSISIFILPPSFEELERRIRGRGTEDENVIAGRMARAREEVKYIKHYDYVVINEDLREAADDISAIIRAEKLRLSRKKNILQEIGGICDD